MTDFPIITREEALSFARQLRGKLLRRKLPIHQIFLYGSIAKGEQGPGSDIDIAIICDPFRTTRFDENMEIRKERRGVNSRISPYCLHPEDMKNPLWNLPHEIKRHGILVE